jgi:hypothetical protein
MPQIPHEETAEYWRAMYQEQLTLKRKLHVINDTLRGRFHLACQGYLVCWRMHRALSARRFAAELELDVPDE